MLRRSDEGLSEAAGREEEEGKMNETEEVGQGERSKKGERKYYVIWGRGGGGGRGRVEILFTFGAPPPINNTLSPHTPNVNTSLGELKTFIN